MEYIHVYLQYNVFLSWCILFMPNSFAFMLFVDVKLIITVEK